MQVFQWTGSSAGLVQNSTLAMFVLLYRSHLGSPALQSRRQDMYLLASRTHSPAYVMLMLLRQFHWGFPFYICFAVV